MLAFCLPGTEEVCLLNCPLRAMKWQWQRAQLMHARMAAVGRLEGQTRHFSTAYITTQQAGVGPEPQAHALCRDPHRPSPPHPSNHFVWYLWWDFSWWMPYVTETDISLTFQLHFPHRLINKSNQILSRKGDATAPCEGNAVLGNKQSLVSLGEILTAYGLNGIIDDDRFSFCTHSLMVVIDMCAGFGNIWWGLQSRWSGGTSCIMALPQSKETGHK